MFEIVEKEELLCRLSIHIVQAFLNNKDFLVASLILLKTLQYYLHSLQLVAFVVRVNRTSPCLRSPLARN